MKWPKSLHGRSETNVFYALAKALWSRGEDGEVIARDLAHAFAAIVREGAPQEITPEQELTRLLQE